MTLTLANTCYLCGNEVSDPTRFRDHVPPKQFYSSALRNAGLANDLLTLPAHEECNKSYQRDEDYFFSTLSMFAPTNTTAGKSVWNDLAFRVKNPNAQGLAFKVWNEFVEKTPGGIYAPDGVIFKQYDTVRIHGIIWKIVRGLFFHEYHRILPVDTPKYIKLVDPDYPPSEIFSEGIRDLPAIGRHPAFFDYKFRFVVQQIQRKEVRLHLWGLLFWDKIIVELGIHDPSTTAL